MDVENVNFYEYFKKTIRTPGVTKDEDFFIKNGTYFYIFFIGSWFLIDVIIFKCIYGENEILRINDGKVKFKSQLKGSEYDVEIQEDLFNKSKFEFKELFSIKSILYLL